jgi:UDP-2,3-diacylglucosamine hydrolase
VFRDYAHSLRGSADLVILGHVHRPVYDEMSEPRMVVLGGWQRGSSHLEIRDATVRFHVSKARSSHAIAESTSPTSV